ncbi:hypothetical protein H1R20_g13717, partial [Candolleomyces eurysporus]
MQFKHAFVFLSLFGVALGAALPSGGDTPDPEIRCPKATVRPRMKLAVDVHLLHGG